MRVGVVDIGTNSTRLLIADVDRDSGAIAPVLRRSEVTRLGSGVDAGGSLADEAIERVLRTLAGYRELLDEHRCEANLGVLTSAVRESTNGGEFAERVRSEFGLDARVLSGDEEAQLTFRGAMSDRGGGGPGGEASRDGEAGGDGADDGADDGDPTVVVDIGGGSTEFIIGRAAARRASAGFHVSLPAGVVRMSERHIHSDPPSPRELQDLAADVRAIFLEGLPAEERAAVSSGIAVAGTATSGAAIDLELDPYDPERVHGHGLTLGSVELLLARLADMKEAQRRRVVGLHPDRAPTIVAGMILLLEAMRAFGLDEVEVSEHDILHGGALLAAGLA